MHVVLPTTALSIFRQFCKRQFSWLFGRRVYGLVDTFTSGRFLPFACFVCFLVVRCQIVSLNLNITRTRPLLPRPNIAIRIYFIKKRRKDASCRESKCANNQDTIKYYENERWQSDRWSVAGLRIQSEDQNVLGVDWSGSR